MLLPGTAPAIKAYLLCISCGAKGSKPPGSPVFSIIKFASFVSSFAVAIALPMFSGIEFAAAAYLFCSGLEISNATISAALLTIPLKAL